MMKTMSRVTIALPPRPYDAVIENGLLQRSGETLRDLFNVIFNVNAAAGGSPAKHQRLFVVTVPPVRRKWGKQLLSSLSAAGFTAKIVEMPNGERHKKLATVEKLCEQLSRLGADRNSVIIAFGGGIVGDVAGLVASLYMRGVDLVQIPTTVLAQVDASIGGKTGVNLRAGKNLVGTFHHPSVVLIDPAVLSTLPEREFRAGLYEALKCGVIGKPELFLALENVDTKELRSDPVKLEWIIAESVKLKAEVVSCDERENGLRRVLNLGHTIGHALEAETGYRRFLHGEAIAWGMIAAANIAAAMGKTTAASRIIEAALRLGPLPKVEVNTQDIIRRLRADKKTLDGRVHFVLPVRIGQVRVVGDVPELLVKHAVDILQKRS